MLEVVNWSENLPTIRPKFRHDIALHYHSIFRPWDQNSTMISWSLYAAAFFLMACSTACISSLFLRREVNLKVLFDIYHDISTINKDTTSFFSFEPNNLWWILSNSLCPKWGKYLRFEGTRWRDEHFLTDRCELSQVKHPRDMTRLDKIFSET